MFEKLRRAFDEIALLATTTKIDESTADSLVEGVVLALAECDVAVEVAEALAKSIRDQLLGRRVPRGAGLDSATREAMEEALRSLFAAVEWFNLEEAVLGMGKPVKIVFLGPNGHGKTTTIAKIGYRLGRRGLSVVMAACDTWRAGAIEQLRLHAEAIGADFIAHRYGADPAAVAFDAIAYASKRGRDVVLIDTAGRLQTDANLMEELKKLVRVVKPDLKVFVGDALTGNDALDQALRFHREIGLDGGVLTKADADAKGGAIVSFIYATRKPVLYLGTGQRYEDLLPFNPEDFIKFIVEGRPLLAGR